MNNRLFRSIFLVLIAIFLVACGSSEPDIDSADDVSDAVVDAGQEDRATATPQPTNTPVPTPTPLPPTPTPAPPSLESFSERLLEHTSLEIAGRMVLNMEAEGEEEIALEMYIDGAIELESETMFMDITFGESMDLEAMFGMTDEDLSVSMIAIDGLLYMIDPEGCSVEPMEDSLADLIEENADSEDLSMLTDPDLADIWVREADADIDGVAAVHYSIDYSKVFQLMADEMMEAQAELSADSDDEMTALITEIFSGLDLSQLNMIADIYLPYDADMLGRFELSMDVNMGALLGMSAEDLDGFEMPTILGDISIDFIGSDVTVNPEIPASCASDDEKAG